MREMTNEAALEQKKHGLPGEFLYDRRLMFSSRSQTLILQCSLKRGQARVPQVYLRDLRSSQYANVLEFATSEALPAAEGQVPIRGARSPVLAPTDHLYFLLTEHHEIGGRATTKVLFIGKMVLPRGAVELWDPKMGALLCTPVELVGADQHGVFAKAGISSPVSPDVGADRAVSYAIVHLRWRERSAEVVGEFPGIFY